MSLLWSFGVTLAFLSTLMTTVGLLLTKVSAVHETKRPWYRRYRFWGGMAVNVISEATLTPAALVFAPITLVAPIGATSIALSVAITRLGVLPGLPKEIPDRVEYGALVLVLVGVVVTSVFGPHETIESTMSELRDIALSAPYVITVTTSMVLGLLWMLAFASCWDASSAGDERTIPVVTDGSGHWFTTMRWRAAQTIVAWRPARVSTTACVSSATLAALSAGAAIISLKVFTTTLVVFFSDPKSADTGLGNSSGTGTSGENAAGKLERPSFMYSLPPGLISSLVMLVVLPSQLVLISMFNQSGDAKLGMPVYMSFILVFSVVLGGLVFNEFARLDALRLSMVMVGVLIIILGVAALSVRQQQKEQQGKANSEAVVDLAAPAHVEPAATADAEPTTAADVETAASLRVQTAERQPDADDPAKGRSPSPHQTKR